MSPMDFRRPSHECAIGGTTHVVPSLARDCEARCEELATNPSEERSS